MMTDKQKREYVEGILEEPHSLDRRTVEVLEEYLRLTVGTAPAWKHGNSIVHVDRADGTARNHINEWAAWVCPECGWFVGEQYIPTFAKMKPHNQQKCNFCSRCGQKIDWNAVERGEL